MARAPDLTDVKDARWLPEKLAYLVRFHDDVTLYMDELGMLLLNDSILSNKYQNQTFLATVNKTGRITHPRVKNWRVAGHTTHVW